MGTARAPLWNRWCGAGRDIEGKWRGLPFMRGKGLEWVGTEVELTFSAPVQEEVGKGGCQALESRKGKEEPSCCCQHIKSLHQICCCHCTQFLCCGSHCAGFPSDQCLGMVPCSLTLVTLLDGLGWGRGSWKRFFNT